MIKKLVLMLALVMLAAQSAYAAPDRVGKTDIGLSVAAAIPDADDSDTAAYVGGSFAYGVQSWLALGASIGWAEFEESASGIEIEERAVPIFADIIFRVPATEAQAQPYAVLGLGAIVWDADINVANVDTDIDTAFAAKLGAGLDWFMNENWILNLEASYVFSDTEATVTNTSTGASISAEGETDFWMVGGAL